MTEHGMTEREMNEPEMTEQEIKKLANLLQQSLPPMNRELDRDLWPKMLQRIAPQRNDERTRDRNWLAVLFSPSALSAVPWFDWALLAAVVVGVCIFPKSIPIWFYHF